MDAVSGTPVSTNASGAYSPAMLTELPMPEDGQAFTTRPYVSRLSLNRMVQPYLSAGGSGAASFLRAGAALSFGDMLGDHRLQTSVQIGSRLDDIMVQAAYLNMRS